MQEKESKTSRHFWISLTKSFIRIVACGFLFGGHIHQAACLLIGAEILGVLEEIL